MGANTSTASGERETQQQAAATDSWCQSSLMTDRNERGGAAGGLRGGDKKRKASRLATLRKKLVHGRRGGAKSVDHSRAFRDAAASWTTREIGMLLESYDAMAVVRELQLLANIARPQANTFRKDLSNLFDARYCTDVDLVFQGIVFPVHRAILSVRCAFFRDLLARHPDFGAQVPIVPRTSGVSVQLFAALLRYLYCGDFHAVDTSKAENVKILRRLAAEFGTPNALEQDMRNLLETGMYSDAVLVFALEPEQQQRDNTGSPVAMADYRRSCGELQLRCHKAVLAARSSFFRSLLLRRAKTGDETMERALHSPTHIVLDVSVIPRRYARVLLHAIYLDTVDLSCIVRNSVSMCSLTEAQAMVTGHSHLSAIDDVMEIYQIGRFLDFPILTQGCEDKLVDSLSPDNIVSILNWSCQAHGSHWVHRQGLQYLRDEYLHICHTPAFYDLNKWYLVEALRSDYVQAGEQDILDSIVRWGEHQLIKRIEEREPNLLTHTAHSVSKKGVKKRDLDDEELRQIIGDLLSCIRIEYVLPSNSDTLLSAVKRGLVCVPPSHFLSEESNQSSTATLWIHSRQRAALPPRLFIPFYEEAKVMFGEQTVQHGAECSNNVTSHVRHIQSLSAAIPDALYMLDTRESPSSSLPWHPASTSGDSESAMPDDQTLRLMKQRQAEVEQTRLVQRALALPCVDKVIVQQAICLIVVREFGLLDTAADVLFEGECVWPTNRQEEEERLAVPCHIHRPPFHRTSPELARLARQHSQPAYHRHAHVPQSFCAVHSRYQAEVSAYGACVPMEAMPDIALATESMGELSVHDSPPPLPLELELDLGDGAAHFSSGTMYV